MSRKGLRGVLYTNFKLAKEARACEKSYKKMAKHLGGITKYGRETPISLAEVLDVCGLDDALWVLRCCTDSGASDHISRIFACDCAERVLLIYERQYPDDKRPRNAIDTARRFVNGEATQEELAAAWAAARAAARAAAWDATWAAAWAAARAAARAAAWAAAAAADAAARDAARAAAWAAAWAAARAAAWDATWAAARDAAWVAEIKWQTERFVAILNNKAA